MIFIDCIQHLYYLDAMFPDSNRIYTVVTELVFVEML